MPRVYLCGPITGLSYGEARNGWRKQISELIDPSIEVLSPMRQEGHLAEIQQIAHKPYAFNPMATARGIVAKDRLDIRRADLVVANFVGAASISVGSVVETSWANALGTPVIMVMEPDGNVHDRFFLTELADFRADSVEVAARMVNALLLPGV